MKLSIFSITWLITHSSYLFCSIYFFDYLAFMNCAFGLGWDKTLPPHTLTHSHANAHTRKRMLCIIFKLC